MRFNVIFLMYICDQDFFFRWINMQQHCIILFTVLAIDSLELRVDNRTSE